MINDKVSVHWTETIEETPLFKSRYDVWSVVKWLKFNFLFKLIIYNCILTKFLSNMNY